MVQINNFIKKYENKAVVDNISFHVKEKEILCVLGPNDVGKSTTINMLTEY